MSAFCVHGMQRAYTSSVYRQPGSDLIFFKNYPSAVCCYRIQFSSSFFPLRCERKPSSYLLLAYIAHAFIHRLLQDKTPRPRAARVFDVSSQVPTAAAAAAAVRGKHCKCYCHHLLTDPRIADRPVNQSVRETTRIELRTGSYLLCNLHHANR